MCVLVTGVTVNDRLSVFLVLISNYLYWYALYLGQTHGLLVSICALNFSIPHLFALLLECLPPTISTCHSLTNSSKQLKMSSLSLLVTPFSQPTTRRSYCHDDAWCHEAWCHEAWCHGAWCHDAWCHASWSPGMFIVILSCIHGYLCMAGL